MKKIIFAFITLLLVFSVNIFVSAEEKTINQNISPTSSTGLNVILISFDVLRPDHMSCYGYQRPTTPNIDKLAKKGIVFTQAIAQASWTLTTQCSLLTGQYPLTHLVLHLTDKLDDGAITFPEILKNYGYYNVGFTGGITLNRIFGVAQGFDEYTDNTDSINLAGFEQTSPLAIDWLHKNKNRKFFMLLQGYDGHAPYYIPPEYDHLYSPNKNKKCLFSYKIFPGLGVNPSAPWNWYQQQTIRDDIPHIIDHYDGAITYADVQVGKLLKYLEESGLDKNTIVIVTSQHGESFGEHYVLPFKWHGATFEEAIRIPLIITHPTYKATTIETQAQLIDIMPTILNLVNIPINKECGGRDLLPLPDKPQEGFNEYTFSTGATKHNTVMTMLTIRSKKWKLHRHYFYPDKTDNSNIVETLRLYNIEKDPKETENLADQEPKIVELLKQKLVEWEKQCASKKHLSAGAQISPELRDNLRKHGYWEDEKPPRTIPPTAPPNEPPQKQDK